MRSLLYVLWCLSNSELLQDNYFFDDTRIFHIYIFDVYSFTYIFPKVNKMSLYKLKNLNKNIVIPNKLMLWNMNAVGQWLHQNIRILRIYIYLIHKAIHL